VPVDPQGHDDYPARDPCALASRWASSLLAVEIPLRVRSAANPRGIAGVDLADERGQSTLGCTAHLWRTAQARLYAVAQSTVAKYMAKKGDPSGQRWSTFLRNHMPHIAAMDLFVVPTIGFIQLYVLVIVRLAQSLSGSM
jgi:hypothetical protein